MQRHAHDASWSLRASMRRPGAEADGGADGRGMADTKSATMSPNTGTPSSLSAGGKAWESVAGVGFTRPFAGNGASGGGGYSGRRASAGRRASVGDYYNVEHLEEYMRYVAVADPPAP